MRLTGPAEQWDVDQRRSISCQGETGRRISPPHPRQHRRHRRGDGLAGQRPVRDLPGSRHDGRPRRTATVGAALPSRSRSSRARGTVEGPSGLTIGSVRAVGDVERTDIVIVPSMAIGEVDWVQGRYPAAVAWIRAMHERGATVCSACTGGMLTAETGLLDGHGDDPLGHRGLLPRASPRGGAARRRELVVSGEEAG